MKMFYKKSFTIKQKLGVCIILIISLTLGFFAIFNIKATPKLIHLAETNMKKYMDHLASDYQRLIVTTSDLNILTIQENQAEEITSMNYNMNKVYTIAEELTKYLEENLSNQSKLNEYLKISSNLNSNQGLILSFPIGQLSNWIFLNQLGPEIPLLVRFIDSVLTNVKTTVTDYGINNALLEVVLEVSLSYEIVTPIQESTKTLSYTILLDSEVIQGSVPNIYGGYLEDKSAFLELPFNPQL